MLKFNQSGQLVPNKNIKATLNDFKTEFVLNIPTVERQILFENYQIYSSNLKKLCNNTSLLQWINGSFVTKILNPGDIDLVTFLDFNLVRDLSEKVKSFTFPLSEIDYGVDAYIVIIYPIGHKNYFLYQSDFAYWMDKFDKTKRNRRGNCLPKGFLEIIY